MSLQFHRVALVGKYQDSASSAVPDSTREIIAEIAGFLTAQGCQVVLAERTAHSTGLDQYPALDVTTIGNECDLAVVVGGDGTMLGIGRQLARYGTPLIGINQGRLGFITDIPLEGYHETLSAMLGGAFEEDHRSLMHGKVMREGECVFEAFAMNDVVVNRGAVASMVELRVEVNGHFVANHRADGIIVATPTGSGLCAVGRRAAAAPAGAGLGAGADRAAHLVEPADRGGGSGGDRHRDRLRQGRQRQLRHAVAGLAAPWRPHRGAALRVPRALSAPHGLELLRHAAQEIALERGRGMTSPLSRLRRLPPRGTTPVAGPSPLHGAPAWPAPRPLDSGCLMHTGRRDDAGDH